MCICICGVLMACLTHWGYSECCACMNPNGPGPGPKVGPSWAALGSHGPGPHGPPGHSWLGI